MKNFFELLRRFAKAGVRILALIPFVAIGVGVGREVGWGWGLAAAGLSLLIILERKRGGTGQ